MTDPKQPPIGGNGNKSGKPRARQENPAVERRAKWLSDGLRKLYDEDASAPIPDSFLDLLDQLERQERKKE